MKIRYHDWQLSGTPLTAIEIEVNRNGGIHFRRITIQQVGLVPPLTNRIRRGSHQHRWSADNTQLLNAAVLGDNCVQNNRSAYVGRTSDRRINRRRLRDNLAGHHTARDTSRSLGLRWLDINLRPVPGASGY